MPLFRNWSGRSGAIWLAVVAATGTLPAIGEAQPAAPAVCAVFVDRTLSLEPAHRGQAVQLLSDGLPHFIRATGCTELVAGTFTDEGPWAPRRWFGVPEPPVATDCSVAEPDSLVGAATLLAGFDGFGRHFREEAIRECRAEQAGLQAAFDTAWAHTLTAARAIIAEPPLERETRTDIVGVLQGLMDASPTVALIVTDGLDTARGAPERVSIPEDGDLVLILVPTRDVYGGREATEEAADLWRRAGAQTVPYTALVSPAAWTRLRFEER